MKKLVKLVLKILLILVILFIFVFKSNLLRNKTGKWLTLLGSNNDINQVEYRAHAKLSKSEVLKLQEGDIILRRGFGKISDLILKHFSEDYGVTHCGVIALKDSIWSVISSESNEYYEGMQITPLRNFLINSKPETIVIVRPNRVEASSNFLYWMRYYLHKKAPFDYKFDDTDTTELYCTEVIDLALKKSLGEDILTERKKVGLINAPSYSNFFDSANFQIVINQFER